MKKGYCIVCGNELCDIEEELIPESHKGLCSECLDYHEVEDEIK